MLPDYRLPESAIYAVMPERRLILPRVRALVDHLGRSFGENPPWERHLGSNR